MIKNRIGRTVSTRGKVLALRIAAGSAVIASTVVVLPALATPGSGFSNAPVSTTAFPDVDFKGDKTDKWDLQIKGKEVTDLGIDRLTVQPGGYSGWHTHTGATFVSVTSGTLTWYDGERCSVTVYHAGDGFIEPANHVHNVANLTGEVATIAAVQLRPSGTSPRVDAAAPTLCHF